jgi:hypothetical protein
VFIVREYTAESVMFQTSIKTTAFLCRKESAYFQRCDFLAAIVTKSSQTPLAIAAAPTYF